MIERLFRTGIRRGLFGSSRAWLAVGAAAGGIRLLGRLARRQEEIVHRQTLEPGDGLVITHLHETAG